MPASSWLFFCPSFNIFTGYQTFGSSDIPLGGFGDFLLKNPVNFHSTEHLGQSAACSIPLQWEKIKQLQVGFVPVCNKYYQDINHWLR